MKEREMGERETRRQRGREKKGERRKKRERGEKERQGDRQTGQCCGRSAVKGHPTHQLTSRLTEPSLSDVASLMLGHSQIIRYHYNL